MGNGLTEYADALDAVKALAEDGLYDEAAALLEDSEGIIDDIYTQLNAQIDSRQNERFEEFVERAESSISFLIENAEMLKLSPAVIDELQTTYDILTSGDTELILGATSETSNVGLTFLMHPGLDNASPTAKDNANGKGLGLGEVHPAIQNLPNKIKDKFGYSTDSNLGTQSTDGTGDENNGDGTSQTDGFFESLFGFGAASDNANSDAQGIGLGKIPWIFDSGFLPDDNSFPPPFAEFGDGVFEPGKYGKDIAAEKRAEAQQRADEGKSHGRGPPDDRGPPDGRGPPDDRGPP